MKKIIAVLAVLLLAVSSAQAVTVLMDENFDSADYHVDLDTLPGWTNDNGSGVFPIRTTLLPDTPVDGPTRGIEKFEGEYFTSFYEYAVSDVTLGAGEYYRYESYWHVIDGEVNQHATGVTRLRHSDDRVIQWYFDPGRVSWQDGLLHVSIWNKHWWESGSEML